MPKFSAYMKGGEGTAGPPGASIIDGIVDNKSQLPLNTNNQYHAFLVGMEDPKTLYVWNMTTKKWEPQGYTASKIASLNTSVTTIAWTTGVAPILKSSITTIADQNYVFNFDFGIPEGQPAGFGQVSISTKKISYTNNPTAEIQTSGPNWKKNFHFDLGIPAGEPAGFNTISVTSERLSYTNKPYASVTSSGSNLAKNFEFKFGIPEGVPGGFSTKQNTSVSTLKWDSPATAEVIPNNNTPNDSKSFLFKFGIPQGRAAGIEAVNAAISSTNWNASPVISATTYGENHAKVIDFDFKVPVGRPAGFGNINVTTTVLEPNREPWVKINSITESPEYEKDFNFEFGLPRGIAAGFSTGQIVTVSTLDTGEQATVEITTITTSPETAKEFNFHFGLPKGDALAIYDGITFTSTADGIGYHWNTNNDIITLIFERGTVKKIPIYIYNANNESIASTFKLTDNTIEYEADEKFDGTMYLMMPATLQNVEIGTVSSTAYGNNPVISKSTGSTSTNLILDFIIPEGYPGHEVIDSITTNINNLSTYIDSITTDINSLSTTKQDKLTWDTTPTTNSNNPVTSNGIKAALDTKINNSNGILYLEDKATQTSNNSVFCTVSNSAITEEHIVAECVFSIPSAITSKVTWNTSNGTLTLFGTNTDANNTATITLVLANTI